MQGFPLDIGPAEAMVVAAEDKIARKYHNIERVFHQGICGERELRSLESL